MRSSVQDNEKLLTNFNMLPYMGTSA
jgi:hypothetical protein